MSVAIKHTLGNTGYFIRYYWKRILIALAMVFVLCGGIAFADSWDDKAETEGETLLSISYGFINDILNPKILTETGELLEIGYDGSEISVGPYTSSGAGAILDSIFKVSCVVAVIVLCISFLTDLAMMRQNDITEENVIRKLFMFVVGYLLIVNSMKICIAIADTGTWVTQHVTASVTMDVNNSADEIKEICGQRVILQRLLKLPVRELNGMRSLEILSGILELRWASLSSSYSRHLL